MKCKIDKCRKSAYRTALCNSHYKRLRRHGDPLAGRKYYEKHRLKDTPEYTSWMKIRQRCNNPNNTHYQYYGGRGIRVCKRWQDSFLAFYKDMGVKPTPSHTIDRINPNGDYKPSNCRWATKSEQTYNQRTRVDNKSGHKGVIWDAARNKWRAEVKFNGKHLINKRYTNKRDAIKAVNLARMSVNM